MTGPRCATMLFLALPLLAQGPGRPAIAMLRDPQRAPVADAQGVLLFDPPCTLPALEAIGGLDTALGAEPRVGATSRSRPTGAMTCPFPADAMSAALLVTTENGLGALVPRLLRGEALPVQLEHVGHVRAADGQPFTLYANALSAGRRILLPAMRADDVPLPPGSYEGWIETAQGVVWQRLEVQANSTTTVATGGPSTVLQRTGDAVVWPAGRRDLVLLGPDRAEVRLLGLAAASALIARSPADGRVENFTPHGGGDGPLRVPLGEPAATHEFAIDGADGAPLGSGTAFVVRRQPSGLPQVRAEAAIAAGRVRLAEPAGGDDWLLVVARDTAPLALPWPEAVRAAHLQLAAGQDLAVACTTGSGEPAIDVCLEYTPEAFGPATLVVHSDRRGHAVIPRATRPGTLTAADARFANAAVAVAADAADPVALHLDPGRELRGTIALPDGTPAAGASITLRDPQGRLRPPERVAIAAADGTFAFAGLDDADYALFATQQRLGHTWSSRIAAARPGTPAALEIRDEDPQFVPPAGRDR
ncbi:MAG: carboxypeptidase-like regulatory domain-containing protein [Planctomycetota bacterium]